MKPQILILNIIALTAVVLSNSYTVVLTPLDTFTVSAPPQWEIEQTKYVEHQDSEFFVESKDNSFVLKMAFMKDNGMLSSPEKVKARMLWDGGNFLEGSIQDEVEIQDIITDKRYGFYAVFTDKKTAQTKNPEPDDYLHMTRGYIRLSEESVLGFWMFTHQLNDKTFHKLTQYLTSYIKE